MASTDLRGEEKCLGEGSCLSDWVVSETADKSSPGNRLKVVTGVERNNSSVSGIYLDVQCRPATVGRGGNDGGEQKRPNPSAAPFGQDVEFLQPATPSAML